MPEPQFIVAHDVGTSGVKCVLTDLDGRVLRRCIVAYPTQFPMSGWAEQEADDWWSSVCAGTRSVVAGADPGAVACVTFSTQMLGLVPISATGAVLRRPIIWLDGRATAEAATVMRRFGGARVFGRVAGATLSGKDGIPKLRWLRFHEPEVWRAMSCFLDVGGYLCYRCTGRMAMDWTEASVFGFDLNHKKWLARIMRYAGVDPAKLPALVRPVDVAGTLTSRSAEDLGLLGGTPVVAGMGDAPAAAVGAGAVTDGDAHVYLGTSGWIGILTGGHPTGRHGIAVIQSGDPQHNMLIAETEAAGGCIAWIADELYRAKDPHASHGDVFASMDRDAAEVPAGSESLLFTPWMYGERVPVNDPYLRAAFLNIGAGHRREHFVRAAYEGVCFNFRWILDLLGHDFRMAPKDLRVVGGGARSAIWMQVLADVTKRTVETVRDPQDAGAVGAALAAGVALGIHRGFAVLRDFVRTDKVFEPGSEAAAVYDSLYPKYKDTYRRLNGLYRALNR